MADTKITDLTALTGANLASGDDLALVDVSDTSMAASGTDKKITANELRIGMATTLGVVGIDKIYDAIGDLPVGTAADVATKLAVGTTGGAALCADPNDSTYKMSWNYPTAIELAARGSTSSLASTFDRRVAVASNVAARTSATLYLFGINLAKGVSVSNITFWSATTALGVGSNQWFALFDSSKNKLAITADDTSTAWAANSSKTLAITGGPYVTTTSGWYYLGYMVKATTMPTNQGTNGLDTALFRAATPICAASADTGLTNPASCPTTAGALTALAIQLYAEVS